MSSSRTEPWSGRGGKRRVIWIQEVSNFCGWSSAKWCGNLVDDDNTHWREEAVSQIPKSSVSEGVRPQGRHKKEESGIGWRLGRLLMGCMGEGAAAGGGTQVPREQVMEVRRAVATLGEGVELVDSWNKGSKGHLEKIGKDGSGRGGTDSRKMIVFERRGAHGAWIWTSGQGWQGWAVW